MILHSAFFIHPSPAIAARLRTETTLPVQWIAARVQIGTAKAAKSVLPHLAQNQDQRETASALELRARLEFQSTVWLTLSRVAGPARFGVSRCQTGEIWRIQKCQ